ncbi:unnamed protein product [Camellia sinensis]
MVAKIGELDFPKFYEDSHISKKMKDWIHPKCIELHQEMVTVQAAAIESGTPLTHKELSTQVLGQKKKVLSWIWEWPTTLYHSCITSTQ